MIKRKNIKQKTIFRKKHKITKILKKKKKYMYVVDTRFDCDLQKVELQHTGKVGYWVRLEGLFGADVDRYINKDNKKNRIKSELLIYKKFNEAKKEYIKYLKKIIKNKQNNLKQAMKRKEL